MNITPWKYNEFKIEIHPDEGIRFIVERIDLRTLLNHPGFLYLKNGMIYSEQAEFPPDCDWNQYQEIAKFWDYFYGQKISLYPGSFNDCPCCELKALIGDIQIFPHAVVWRNFLIEPSSPADHEDEMNRYQNFTFVFNREQYDNQLENIYHRNDYLPSNNIISDIKDFITPSRHLEKTFSFYESIINRCKLNMDQKEWENPFHYYKQMNNSNNVELMTKAILECAFQNPYFFDGLESVDSDCFIKVIGDDPFWNSTSDGYGKNMLGYALMKVRDTLNGTENLRKYSVDTI